jgi:peroxiredoxin
MTKKTIGIGGIVLVGIIVLFIALYIGGSVFVLKLTGEPLPQPTGDDRALLNHKAPYFDLPNIAGDHVRLSEYEGSPLVVLFWASWNADSTNALSILNAYEAAHAANPLLKVVTINSLEERSLVSSYMKRGKYTVTALVDAQGGASGAYKVKGLPTYYFIDSSGVLREIYNGTLSPTMLGDKMESILR